MLPGVSASIRQARETEPNDSPSARSGASVIPAEATFRAALATAKGAAGPEPVTPSNYFDLVPPEPTFVMPGASILGQTFGSPGSTRGPTGPGSIPLGPIFGGPGSPSNGPTFIGGPTTLGPTEVWPGGTVAGPVSPNKAAGPQQPEPEDPEEPLSRAQEAAVYAEEAANSARMANEYAGNAGNLGAKVQAEAAIARNSGKTPKQIADALTEAKNGVNTAAKAAKAADVAAFDAGVDAAAAAAAEDEGNEGQATAETAAAAGAAGVAMTNEQAALDGWAKVLFALRSLSPNV